MNFLYIPSTSEQAKGYPPEDPAIAYTFPLDPFQQQAVLAIHRGDNVLVTAKTGSGKTLVGEYQIAYSLKQGKRVFYTTPIKSLSNQKYHDLKHLFPKNTVGIMTGDIKSNPEADIVVMTTEILRNLLFKQSTSTAHLGTAGQVSLENVDAVVFDEVHYINDPDRGHVWEETMILLPPEIKLILLSATIDSPELFAGWLGQAKQRPIVLLKTTYRIVPLVHGVYDPTTPIGELPLQPLKKGDEAPYQPRVYNNWLHQKEVLVQAAEEWAVRVKAAQVEDYSMAGAKGKVKLKSFTHSLNECVEQLQKRDLLPALFFVFSRKECERYADKISGSLIDSSDQASVRHIISFHLHKYNATLEHLPQYHQIVGLLERGVAFHHSGLLPLLKEIVELLFSRGFIKVLFCTETFAVGLNMPARTVVFLDLKKPGDADGFRPLRPDEYIQMAGRAGRRGKDTQGVVIYLPARKPVEPDEIRHSLAGSLVPLQSRLQFHYDFILKALHSNAKQAEADTEKAPLWSAVIQNSYWQAQREQAIQELDKDIAALRKDMAAIQISDAECAELDTKQMLEAQVKATVNAARKKAQAALDQWKDRHMGPKWANATKFYDSYKRLDSKVKLLEAQKMELEKPADTDRVNPILCALQDWHALNPVAEDVPTLTEFGILATEINEGNPLLIAKLYESGLLKDAKAEEIVGTLGAFIVDRESTEKSEHPRALPPFVSDRVKDVLLTLDTWGQEGRDIDRKNGIESPEQYWDITTLWTMIGTEWYLGEEAGALTKKYEIYEGNLMRGLLKLTNLVNEWISLATYKADVDMLETLKDVQVTMLRDIAQPESLYLRM